MNFEPNEMYLVKGIALQYVQVLITTLRHLDTHPQSVESARELAGYMEEHLKVHVQKQG
jgi:hypothetical protein